MVELMVTVALVAVLAMVGVPEMAEYLRNSRLREAGSVVQSALQLARSEAVKRNERLELGIVGRSLVLADSSGNTIRSNALPEGLSAQAEALADGAPVTSIAFGGAGRTVPLGANYRVNVAVSGGTCDGGGTRCPRVLVRSGGAVKFCSTQEDC